MSYTHRVKYKKETNQSAYHTTGNGNMSDSYVNWLEDELTKAQNQEPITENVCFDYVEGINMDCQRCGEPEYKH